MANVFTLSSCITNSLGSVLSIFSTRNCVSVVFEPTTYILWKKYITRVTQGYGGLGLWCLMPLSTIFQLHDYCLVSFMEYGYLWLKRKLVFEHIPVFVYRSLKIYPLDWWEWLLGNGNFFPTVPLGQNNQIDILCVLLKQSCSVWKK